MSRFKILLEYEGTRYSGWQIQKNARTVQGEIIRALQTTLKTTEFEFQGSGRTDAGVHALEQTAHLDCQSMLAPEIIRKKVNDELPADINILEVEKVPGTFHARHDARSRSYLYQISLRRTALGKRFVWWIKERLDFQQMQDVTGLFVGMNNLESFTDDDPEEKSTKVLIDSMEMKQEGDLILIRIGGSHFIWKAVRRIVGVVAEVGRGKLSREHVEQFLATRSDAPARLTAPPSGLFLEKVYYAGDTGKRGLVPVMEIRSVGLNK